VVVELHDSLAELCLLRLVVALEIDELATVVDNALKVVEVFLFLALLAVHALLAFEFFSHASFAHRLLFHAAVGSAVD